jgi:RimJ/RimL family protein N-acetyltransferase
MPEIQNVTWLTPTTLRGSAVTLEPLALRHHDDLVEALCDGELWNLWYTSVPKPEQLVADIERRLVLQSEGSTLPFAVIDHADGKAVGMNSYVRVDVIHRRVEIGTWYRQRVQRTSINTESQLLLLRHAFETLGCIAVEFRTHSFNHQTRRALERGGAKLDGILRCHQRASNGTLRDTCVYSIVAAEWPTVQAHLSYQLAKPR